MTDGTVDNQRIIQSFWRDPDVKLQRILILVLAVFLFWAVFVVYMLWAWQTIPSLPPSTYFYAGIYYIPFIPTFFTNLLVPCQRIGNLYVIAWVFNLVSWLFGIWLMICIAYQLFWCYQGSLPQADCSPLQTIQWILLFVTFWITALQTVIFFLYCLMLAGIHQLRSVTGIYT